MKMNRKKSCLVAEHRIRTGRKELEPGDQMEGCGSKAGPGDGATRVWNENTGFQPGLYHNAATGNLRQVTAASLKSWDSPP